MPCPTKHSVPNMVNGVILGSGFPPSPPESRSHQPCAPASSARPGSPLPAQSRPWVRATSGESQGCGAGSLRLCLWPPLTSPGGGGQRLLGNGQSEALKLPWVRPTELLGLPSTLPDVTLLLADGTVRLEGAAVWVSGLQGLLRRSEQLREAGFSVAPRAGLGLRRLFSRWQERFSILIQAPGPGLKRILPLPGRVI